jgi:hypothetical protein
VDQRTLAQLATEALQVQDACNLSGVVHAWSRSIRRLREIRPELGTDAINKHPINVMFSDKVGHLTNSENGSWCADAWQECVAMSNTDAEQPVTTPAPVPDGRPF